MRVSLKGLDGRFSAISKLSKGTMRYYWGLRAALVAAGVEIGDNPDLTHFISPVLFPSPKPLVVSTADIAPLSRWNRAVVDYDSPTLRTRLYVRYIRLITTRSFEAAKAIIVISTQEAREIELVFPQHKDKIRWVSPGLEPRFKRNGARHDRPVRIGYYRNATPSFWEATSHLERLKHDFSLCPLDGIPEERIVEYYSGLDYFIDLMPFRGFGYPIVEAASCGVTVLTLSSSVIPDEVKACTIQVAGPEAAAETIVSGKRKFSPWPRTLEEMGRDMLKVYQEALA